MSGRIFQNVVLQLKENTDRTVGVIDAEGIVIACSELSMIGQRWAENVPVVNAAGGSMVTSDGKTFKALNGWSNQFDYAAFAFGFLKLFVKVPPLLPSKTGIFLSPVQDPTADCPLRSAPDTPPASPAVPAYA